MGDDRLPKRILSGKLQDAGHRARGDKKKAWRHCVADTIVMFQSRGDWGTAGILFQL